LWIRYSTLNGQNSAVVNLKIIRQTIRNLTIDFFFFEAVSGYPLQSFAALHCAKGFTLLSGLGIPIRSGMTK
jgi:hypothetical protein